MIKLSVVDVINYMSANYQKLKPHSYLYPHHWILIYQLIGENSSSYYGQVHILSIRSFHVCH